MAKAMVVINGGMVEEIVTNIPDLALSVWDKDLRYVDKNYDEYEKERKEFYEEVNNAKFNYLVAIKNYYTRDIQIAQNLYINKLENEDIVDSNLDWQDFEEGEVIIGVFQGFDELEAISEAATSFFIEESALKAYPLA